MSRKFLVPVVAVVLACAAAAPALARALSGHRTLHMTTRIYPAKLHALHHLAMGATLVPGATVTYQGYRCESTVDIQKATPRNIYTYDSSEFTTTYTENGQVYRSVTSNCIGIVPSKYKFGPSSHMVACKQFNPDNMNGPTIQGYGISTTYPNRLFSETCTTPDYSGGAVTSLAIR